MLQKNFKEFYLNELLDFLWRQWSCLGISGGAKSEEWIIDPEALLLFSLDIARYEPRLFDEILDWLVLNGKWIDIQRLRGIIKNKNNNTVQLIGVVAKYISTQALTYQRKWNALSQISKANDNKDLKSFFITKNGKDYINSDNSTEKIFKDYGFLRNKIILSKKSKTVTMNSGSNIRFLLRSLFGIGSRAECILYLLTHEAGHPSEVADAIGISVRGAQDTLIELAESGLVLTRNQGKRKIEYWISHKKWWEFLLGMPYEEKNIPIWLNWISLFSSLTNIWKTLNEIETKSDYLRSSKLRQEIENIKQKFLKSKMDIPSLPGDNIPSEKYEQEFQIFIKKVLGALDKE